jgi:cystathionine gamma-synthase
MDISTVCVHGCNKRYDSTGAIAVPIFASSTFAHPGVGQSTGFDYSRSQNPTKEYLEHTVAALEGGSQTAAFAVAFSSGMAAVSALMELFSPGDHIVAADDLYGGTFRLFSHISQKNGIGFSFAGTPENIEKEITQATKAVFIETPTNPMMSVIDIAAVAHITQKNNLLLIVDNTFLTPVFQRPLSLGADIVLHSGTKYLGGHNDTLAGMLVVKDDALAERLRFISKTTGANLSPFDSFLLIRGIKTLAIRMERQQGSALAIARWLAEQSKIKMVLYTGLPEHPGYEISCRQSNGFGGMISFTVYDEQTAVKILESVKVIKYAESLGGVESLITYPMLQTHADLPESERKARGIDNCLLRLSVGLEAADDLIADLKQAMGS